MKWRLLDSGFSDCYVNMAVDEAMLTEYSKNGSPTLRIYGWMPKAFSIGYSQNPENELDLIRCKENNIHFVRRMTGGGLIFHNQELTYSLICSQDDIGASGFVKESYKIVCSFLINAYKKLGLDPQYTFCKNRNRKDSWFCFSEKEKYDITIDAKKIGGNAQRRIKDLIFQHGSIPLKSDIEEAVLYLKERPSGIEGIGCLEGFLGGGITYEDLKEILAQAFEETFSVSLSKEDLTYREEELTKGLTEEKYRTQEWNLYRDADIDAKASLA